MPEVIQAVANVPRPHALRARNLALGTLLGFSLAAAPAASIEAAPDRAMGISDCAPYFDTSRYRNHEYEVCTTYIVNSSEIALQGFYKFGNNRAGYLSAPARHHFETRYWGGPRRAIERRVDSWPKTSRFTGNKVEESIDVVSVSSSLRADRGLVRAREDWQVTSPGGKVLYREPRHTKDITMCRGRLAGHPLHLWFVVKYARDPGFNCIAFDKSHGLKP